jgi:DNA polymerase III alpha subunit
MSIAHLHAQSWYSFGRGTASPDALCAAAARQGVEALALTDLDGLYGVPEFLEAADRHGVHPVVGAAIPDPKIARSQGAGRAVVLARDGEGYIELCRLVSRRRAEPLRPLPSLLEGLSEHVWILSPDLSLLKALLRSRGPRFLLAELRAATRWERLAEEAEALGIPAVGTPTIQLADASDRRFQRLLRAAHGQLPFKRVGPEELASERGWMLDEGATRAAFSRWPEAPARALDVARDCRVTDLFTLVGGDRTTDAREAAARIRARVLDAAARRGIDGLAPRVERELGVLCRGARPLALEVVADLADFAHARGLVTTATPPAAGSVVAWLLGLLPRSPLDSGLPFPSLCNEAADGALRLDLSVAPAGRARLIQRLRDQLGADRVATPGAVLRWDLWSAARDVARAAGLPSTECERMLGLLPTDWRGEGPDELVARCPRLAGAGLDEAPWERVLRAAARLSGVPRGLGAGEGVLVATGPIADRVPLETVDGALVAQWDRGVAASVGLLALRLPEDPTATLQLRARRGVDDAFDPACPPVPALAAALAAGDTVGCPGLEEPGVRRALRRAAPGRFDALLSVTSFVPVGSFAEDRAGRAAAQAGLGEEDADLLLRVLRQPDDRAGRPRLRQLFVEGLRASGESMLGAAQAWDRLVVELPAAPLRAAEEERLVSGLRSLALRRERPAAFFAATLSLGEGAWPPHVHAAEARRAGVELVPPCVQSGPVDTRAVDGAVHLGLGQVRGVRSDLCLVLDAERRDRGPFADLEDFIARVPATVDEVDVLISAGALDALEPERSRINQRLLHRHLRPFRQRPRSGTRRRARPRPPAEQDPPWEELDAPRRAARLRGELEAFGFTVSGDAIDVVAAELPDGVCDGTALVPGAPVVLAGWHAAGALGGDVVPPDLRWWLVLDCGGALVDVSVPDRLVRTGPRRDAVRSKGPWRVAGTVQARGGLVWVEATSLHRLGEQAGIGTLAESA